MKIENGSLAALLGAALATALVPLHGGVLLLQGTFSMDDQIQLLPFNVATAGLVTLRTYSYAGGTDATKQIIVQGGFDPVLTLFDTAGNLLNSNDDGPCAIVGHDAVTGNCFDAYLSLNLTAGAFTLALTQSDNLAIGPTFADGFLQSGNGDFTCTQFLGQAGGFCDASPARRSNAWALDIVTPDAPGNVPEPAPLLLLAAGAVLLAGVRRFENTEDNIS